MKICQRRAWCAYPKWKSLALVGFLLAFRSFSQTADTFNPNANSTVYSLALQSDGSLLSAGNFTLLSSTSRGSLGRFNPDSTPDAMFNPPVSGGVPVNNPIYCMAVQPDGKLLVGGSFTN